MSSILKAIKERLDLAIKNQEKEKRTSLRTLVGDIQRLPVKEPENATVIKVINKIISGNKEIMEHRERPDLLAENELLSSFLPAMMTESEIKTAFENSGAKDMPSMMRYLSTNHKGLFDGGTAKGIALTMSVMK